MINKRKTEIAENADFESHFQEIFADFDEYEYGIPTTRHTPVWQDPRNAGAPFTMENGLMPVLIV